ncbi:MAG TPA: restriction endonuclease subunit R, partial [Chloroflexota bacterium]|nr:restriction endonuclease subunit R [Chloroflexota bacterium]
IEQRKQEALDYQQYLAKIIDLAKQVRNPALGASYPQTLNTGALRALYDNLGHDEELAIKVDAAVRHTKQDAWRGHVIKERKVKYALAPLLPDENEADRIFELLKNQREY